MDNVMTWVGWIGTIIACLTGAGAMIGKVIKAVKDLKKPIQDMTADVRELKDSVARLSGDRLNQAYDHYVAQGWCPGSKKRELEEWYTAYKAAGYNHLADHYLDVLMELPEKPD